MFVLKSGYTPYTPVSDGRFQMADIKKKVKIYDFHFGYDLLFCFGFFVGFIHFFIGKLF